MLNLILCVVIFIGCLCSMTFAGEGVSWKAPYEQCIVHYQNKEYEKALDCINKVLESKDYPPSAQYTQGALYIMLEKWEEALRALRLYLQLENLDLDRKKLAAQCIKDILKQQEFEVLKIKESDEIIKKLNNCVVGVVMYGGFNTFGVTLWELIIESNLFRDGDGKEIKSLISINNNDVTIRLITNTGTMSFDFLIQKDTALLVSASGMGQKFEPADAAMILTSLREDLSLSKPTEEEIKKAVANARRMVAKEGALQQKKGKAESVELRDSVWTVVQVDDVGKQLTSNNLFAENKETTGRFIRICFRVKNKTNKEVRIMDTPKVIDAQGREFREVDMLVAYIPAGTKGMAFEAIPATMEREFWAIYEVSSDSKGLQFQVRELSMFGKKAVIDIGL
ncbi:hypothetical protein KKC91_06170 [bacterium]|nr:hypothetical protein [bacterium]